MKLSPKIQILRKGNNYSQEELSIICNVSRQSISKWEADITLMETEKLILLSNLFKVIVDEIQLYKIFSYYIIKNATNLWHFYLFF